MTRRAYALAWHGAHNVTENDTPRAPWRARAYALAWHGAHNVTENDTPHAP